MTKPIEDLLAIMQQLRDPEKGCPWDKKQTFDSIVPYTIEETYEVVDAIHNQDWDNLKEELGDLVFQVIFYSQIAQESQLFDFNDVVQGLNQKLIQRHPHVFSDKNIPDEQALHQQWEQQKQKEKAERGQIEQSILDSIPKSLPALDRANKIQKKAAKQGFDWPNLPPVVDKIQEELDEVMAEVHHSSPSSERIEDEIGDVLFSVVNLARHLKVNPEVALAKANLKFEKRFRQLEKNIQKMGKKCADCSLEFLDSEWEKTKRGE